MMAGLLSTAVVPALGGEYASITPHPGTERDPLFAMTIHSPAAVELFGSTLAPFLQPAGVQGPIRYYRVAQRTPPPPAKKDDPAPAAAHPAPQSPKAVPSFIALTPNLLLMSHDEPLVRRAAVAVPVALVPRFLAEARAAVEAAEPGARVYAFGHLGDGNIHFNLLQPVGTKPEAFTAKTAKLNRIVHDIVAGMGGSVSAEHGIGRLKRGEFARYADAGEIELMRRIKAALDPKGILNPGKLLPPE